MKEAGLYVRGYPLLPRLVDDGTYPTTLFLLFLQGVMHQELGVVQNQGYLFTRIISDEQVLLGKEFEVITALPIEMLDGIWGIRGILWQELLACGVSVFKNDILKQVVLLDKLKVLRVKIDAPRMRGLFGCAKDF